MAPPILAQDKAAFGQHLISSQVKEWHDCSDIFESKSLKHCIEISMSWIWFINSLRPLRGQTGVARHGGSGVAAALLCHPCDQNVLPCFIKSVARLAFRSVWFGLVTLDTMFSSTHFLDSKMGVAKRLSIWNGIGRGLCACALRSFCPSWRISGGEKESRLFFLCLWFLFCASALIVSDFRPHHHGLFFLFLKSARAFFFLTSIFISVITVHPKEGEDVRISGQEEHPSHHREFMAQIFDFCGGGMVLCIAGQMTKLRE